MTREPAAQAVHERLEYLAAAMPEPDIEAGWAVLVAQLEPPVAPVVPLQRRHRRWRGGVIGIAAAVLIAGAAFAAVHQDSADQRSASAGSTVTSGHPVVGSRAHPTLSGPPPTPHTGPTDGSDHHGGGTSSTDGGSTESSGGSGDAPSGPTHHETRPAHHDSPDDTDNGTGNDGTHDDNGQGNNTQGQDTQGDGNSSGGSGNEQGSGGGQGSGDRGTHGSGGGERPSANEGSDGDHGSSGQGQGGGGQGSSH
jgi:hypothetical protein